MKNDEQAKWRARSIPRANTTPNVWYFLTWRRWWCPSSQVKIDASHSVFSLVCGDTIFASHPYWCAPRRRRHTQRQPWILKQQTLPYFFSHPKLLFNGSRSPLSHRVHDFDFPSPSWQASLWLSNLVAVFIYFIYLWRSSESFSIQWPITCVSDSYSWPASWPMAGHDVTDTLAIEAFHTATTGLLHQSVPSSHLPRFLHPVFIIFVKRFVYFSSSLTFQK